MIEIKLRELRESKKLTQQHMADYLSVKRPTYTRYETGTNQPDFETIIKLSEFFDVSVDYLLGKTNENEKRPSSEEDRRNLLIQFADGDQRKIDLINYVLSLNSRGLDRIEKLLDAAELLPRE